MCDIILTISHSLIFILLVFLVKHMLANPIQPHKSFMMSVECLSLKCLSKTIAFIISSWLVDNSIDVSSFESVSDTKLFYVDVLGSFTTWFPSTPFQLDCAHIILFNSYVGSQRFQKRIHINRSYLWFKGTLHPHDKCHRVINTYEFSFISSLSIDLLFCRYR